MLAACVVLLAGVGDAKKEKKKKKKFYKEADLLCSACENMVERVEWNTIRTPEITHPDGAQMQGPSVNLRGISPIPEHKVHLIAKNPAGEK